MSQHNYTEAINYHPYDTCQNGWFELLWSWSRQPHDTFKHPRDSVLMQTWSLGMFISKEEHSRNQHEAADRPPTCQLNLNQEVTAKMNLAEIEWLSHPAALLFLDAY